MRLIEKGRSREQLQYFRPMESPVRASDREIDPDALAAFTFQVWNYKQGQMVSLMIQLGDRLGLYGALDGAGPVSADELSARTGLHPRWLLEWLRGQAAARLVEHHSGDRFELTPEAALVLARADEVTFAAAAFDEERPADYVDRLSGAFRSGIGLTYDDLGRGCAHHVERMLGPVTRALLVPVVIPALDGVQAKLEGGAMVADVGCGAGLALELLAQAFPQSQFHGYDLSRHAIETARDRMTRAGLVNVEFHHDRAEDISHDLSFDLVLTFDCMHDMTRPDRAIDAIRRSLKPDGTWLIKDIRSAPDFADNLKNPMLALMYASSVATCMSSAMSEPDGLGLGTLGFNAEVAEAMVRAGGFTGFRVHDFPDKANLYYEVRI
jgi:2-polyprenyl-3-methyl-5-hydroxy-6-metoxy-1,4-benzoquinol methylase